MIKYVSAAGDGGMVPLFFGMERDHRSLQECARG